LRHLDQYRRGYALSFAYSLEEHVRHTYAVEADAQAFVVLFAWSAPRMEDGDLWSAVQVLGHFEDIAAAYGAAVAAGASPTMSMRTAFSEWFHSDWRREQYYYSAASNYLDQLDEKHAIRGYDTFPSDHFAQLCLMADGSNYGCQFTEEIEQKVRPGRR
jgi:hypothetical protein